MTTFIRAQRDDVKQPTSDCPAEHQPRRIDPIAHQQHRRDHGKSRRRCVDERGAPELNRNDHHEGEGCHVDTIEKSRDRLRGA